MEKTNKYKYWEAIFPSMAPSRKEGQLNSHFTSCISYGQAIQRVNVVNGSFSSIIGFSQETDTTEHGNSENTMSNASST